jgi:hypothetical protein
MAPANCYEQPAHPPVVLSDMNGFKLCGKRGGTSFLNARRAIAGNNGNLTCADANDVPCDYQGVAGKTYCVRKVTSGS